MWWTCDSCDLSCVQVKAKYDGVARLWNSLPTNAQLLQMQAMTEDEMTARVSREANNMVVKTMLLQLHTKTNSTNVL